MRGQAALSFVFLVGAVIVLIGTSLAFLAISFVNSSFGLQASQRALAVGTSGVHDALLQLVRNKDFSDTLGYAVPVGADTATVTVAQNVPAAGQATVVSRGAVSVFRRTLTVVVSIHPLTGQLKLLSWQRS
ncbi:hypothetical protein C4587_00300 [Candidatus Parcubacteria bacterium]|nr:MAG: hypothetical protein C4587_00300 [Candidatus Parcubacteria bacterium]